MELDVPAVGHKSAITALGDSKPMFGGVGLCSQGFVELSRCATAWNGYLFWELVDWLAWLQLSISSSLQEDSDGMNHLWA